MLPETAPGHAGKVWDTIAGNQERLGAQCPIEWGHATRGSPMPPSCDISTKLHILVLCSFGGLHAESLSRIVCTVIK